MWGRVVYQCAVSFAVVVLAIQVLMFAVLLGVTCLLCHSSDSETYWLAGLAGFFALTLYSWIKFLANVVSPSPLFDFL